MLNYGSQFMRNKRSGVSSLNSAFLVSLAGIIASYTLHNILCRSINIFISSSIIGSHALRNRWERQCMRDDCTVIAWDGVERQAGFCVNIDVNLKRHKANI